MTTNKTPIQELIEDLAEHCDFYVGNEEEWLQKEKAFASLLFSCGHARGYQSAIYAFDEEKTAPTFEQFYSQYAKQHKQ